MANSKIFAAAVDDTVESLWDAHPEGFIDWREMAADDGRVRPRPLTLRERWGIRWGYKRREFAHRLHRLMFPDCYGDY